MCCCLERHHCGHGALVMGWMLKEGWCWVEWCVTSEFWIHTPWWAPWHMTLCNMSAPDHSCQTQMLCVSSSDTVVGWAERKLCTEQTVTCSPPVFVLSSDMIAIATMVAYQSSEIIFKSAWIIRFNRESFLGGRLIREATYERVCVVNCWVMFCVILTSIWKGFHTAGVVWSCRLCFTATDE